MSFNNKLINSYPKYLEYSTATLILKFVKYYGKQNITETEIKLPFLPLTSTEF